MTDVNTFKDNVISLITMAVVDETFDETEDLSTLIQTARENENLKEALERTVKYHTVSLSLTSSMWTALYDAVETSGLPDSVVLRIQQQIEESGLILANPNDEE